MSHPIQSARPSRLSLVVRAVGGPALVGVAVGAVVAVVMPTAGDVRAA